jgi:hypothetical protein
LVGVYLGVIKPITPRDLPKSYGPPPMETGTQPGTQLYSSCNRWSGWTCSRV